MAADTIPHKIGRYEIKNELRRGGQSTVFLAHDPHFNRDVALKLLPIEFLHDPTFLERFDREAKTLASLEHNAIVPVYDFGKANGQPYLVMRLMNGGNLADRIALGAMPLYEVDVVLSRIAPALDKAHSQGIIHRDIKPGNILFDLEGKAYLSDFGTVKFAETVSTVITATGTTLGTPAYMSPEQARAMTELDGRSDVYSLGIVLYQMLSGKLPYNADTPMGLAMMHVLEPVPQILSARGDLNPALEPIISKALAKKREDRYPSATALAKAVSNISSGPIPVSADPMKTEFGPPAFTLEKEVKKSNPKLPIPAWLIVLMAVAVFIAAALLTANAIGIFTAADETELSADESVSDEIGSLKEVVEESRVAAEVVVSETAPVTTQDGAVSDSPTLIPTASTVDGVIELNQELVGSEERPIKVLFPPIHQYDPEISIPHVEELVDDLERATGINFDLDMTISYEGAIEQLCNSSDDSMGIIGPAGYVLANQRCGVTDSWVALRFGYPSVIGQVVVKSDSDVQSLKDLDGLTWGVSVPRLHRPHDELYAYEFPRAMMLSAGVEPSEIIRYPDFYQPLIDVSEGKIDFATSWFSPPLLPESSGRTWEFGSDDPEIWRDAGEQLELEGPEAAGGPSEGGYTIMDSRRVVQESAPDIFEKTRILLLTERVPNSGIVFGPDFPKDLAVEIINYLEKWINNENPNCLASVCNSEFLRWEGITLHDDSSYDPIRFMINTSGISEEEIFENGW